MGIRYFGKSPPTLAPNSFRELRSGFWETRPEWLERELDCKAFEGMSRRERLLRLAKELAVGNQDYEDASYLRKRLEAHIAGVEDVE